MQSLPSKDGLIPNEDTPKRRPIHYVNPFLAIKNAFSSPAMMQLGVVVFFR